MKQIFLIPTSALVAVCALSSCQKEEMSCTQLVQELTSVLQKVTDYDSAQAAAPRVEALMKRWQRAAGRPSALNSTALLRSVGTSEGAPEKEYVEALDALAEQIARVTASYPSLSHDGEIDEERLKRAVGAKGATKSAQAASELKLGEEYIATFKKKNTNFDGDANNTVCNFEPCFGSVDLKNALGIREEANSSLFVFDGEADVIATPEYTAPAAAESAAPAEDATGDSSDGEEPAADDSSDGEEPAADDSSDDEEPAADDSSDDEEPAADDSSDDEEPAADDSSDDEEPAADDSSDDEEPAADDSSDDEEPAAEDSGDDSLDDFSDGSDFDLGL